MTMTRRTFLGRAVATVTALTAIHQGVVPLRLPGAVSAPSRGWEHEPQPFGHRTRWVQLVGQDDQVIEEAGARPVEFASGQAHAGYLRSTNLNEVVFNTPTSDWGVVGSARVFLADGRVLIDIPLTTVRHVDETCFAPALAPHSMEVRLG